MTQEIVVRDSSSLEVTPSDVVARATIQAKLLMDIVVKTGCFQEISGKRYLQVEAWETIGAFNRTVAATKDITPIMREGEIVGYSATIDLLKDGIVVGRATMPCFFTENACKGKEGDGKHKAAMSAAQTFATSKAYRMNFSYVAILAGYEPVPAEEMGDTHPATPSTISTEHWCKEHDTPWFQKGKMKSYAHPIEGSDKWCYEPKAPSKLAESPMPDEKEPPRQAPKKAGLKQVAATVNEAIERREAKTREEIDSETMGSPDEDKSLRADPKTSYELAAWCKDLKLTGDDIKSKLGLTWAEAASDIPSTVASIKEKFPEHFQKQREKH